MRLLFAGSPAIAVPALETAAALEGEGVVLAGVLTNPDSRRGRGGRAEPAEVAAAALRLGLPPGLVLKPERLDAEARREAAERGADLLVSFAYGRIFGPRFLGLFPLGGINVHPSLLPRYRGPTPLQAAILGGDAETGLTIQELAPEMDSGGILAQERLSLSGRETAEGLSLRAAELGAAMLGALLRRAAASGALPGARPQEGEPSYCSLISREDGRIDWGLDAVAIDRRIRAYTPWPLCFTVRGGEELYILAGHPREEPAPGSPAEPGTVLGADGKEGILIQTGRGIFVAGRLQYRSRKALGWKDFLNGARDFIGSRLG
ncbi:MAG: methionyl-tRNA formyltransferase [Spirochaetaceae bacterium]|jgi:methionyl-tRNA formyltransferase|nr:methionyl-tRNA formyltransferase [Spirochaetaceae bacterium]